MALVACICSVCPRQALQPLSLNLPAVGVLCPKPAKTKEETRLASTVPWTGCRQSDRDTLRITSHRCCGAGGSCTYFPDTFLCSGVSELKEEVVYYDVCEDAEELQSLAHAGPHQPEPAAVRQLRRRLQTLETKRGSICARRAYLRNKRVCVCVGGGRWER